MSERLLKGIGVSPGIAIGPAVIVRSGLPEVPHRVVARTQVEKEVRRLRAAVRDVKRHIAELKARAEDRAGPDQARIFDAQVLMLEDREFLSGIANLIRENHLTAEKAFEFKVLEVRDLWAASRSARLKERLADLNGLAIRMIQHLMHRSDEELERISRPSILVAREIGPGLTVQFDREQVIALVSEEGTKTSHAAILAHSMGMPAVMGYSCLQPSHDSMPAVISPSLPCSSTRHVKLRWHFGQARTSSNFSRMVLSQQVDAFRVFARSQVVDRTMHGA